VAPGRHASAADVLADLAGIALGLAVGQVVRRVRAARAEGVATTAPASRTPP
jgi:VanZ family protein